MKFRAIIMLLKLEAKTTQGGNDYLVISFADTITGNTFNCTCKDMEYISLKTFNQYNAEFVVIQSKYGTSLQLMSIEER